MIQNTKLRMPLNPNTIDIIGVILQISVGKPSEKPSPVSPYMAGRNLSFPVIFLHVPGVSHVYIYIYVQTVYAVE